MKKWVFVIIGLLALAAWQGWALYDGIVDQHEKELQKAAGRAMERYDLNEVLAVSSYHGTHAYHVVKAVNKNKETVFVWIPEKKGKSFVKPAEAGLSKAEVKQFAKQKFHPKKLIRIRLGAEKGIPLWELVYIDQHNRYTFYYLSFDGENWIKNIRL